MNDTRELNISEELAQYIQSSIDNNTMPNIYDFQALLINKGYSYDNVISQTENREVKGKIYIYAKANLMKKISGGERRAQSYMGLLVMLNEENAELISKEDKTINVKIGGSINLSKRILED